MTRSERIRVACERFAEGRPDERAETVDQGIEAALDAALADVGGLDGLSAIADLALCADAMDCDFTLEREPVNEDEPWIARSYGPAGDVAGRSLHEACVRLHAALRESEAGS